LTRRGFDANQAKRNERLQVLDARETLAAFAPAGRVDAAAFAAVVGDAVTKACGGRPDCPVRVYGEMVDLLWRQAHVGNAIRVEALWNALARTHRFDLYCSYRVDDIASQIGDPHIHAICDEHTFVSFPSARSES
jgi:hypothetical protein